MVIVNVEKPAFLNYRYLSKNRLFSSALSLTLKGSLFFVATYKKREYAKWLTYSLGWEISNLNLPVRRQAWITPA